jgi:hypothetical protein
MSDDCCNFGWEQINEDTILAFDSRRRTNADLIVDVVNLGLLHDGMAVLDATYGKGRFWTKWRPRPENFVTNDLDTETAADVHEDFRALPAGWANLYDFTVFDPPYGLRGTVNNTNGDYGLGEYLSVEERHKMMRDGFHECVRVTRPGGYVLFKLQDQTCSGWKHHQTKLAWDWAGDLCGAATTTLVCELHVHSHRKQPTENPDGSPRHQKLVHQNYSTAQIWQKIA